MILILLWLFWCCSAVPCLPSAKSRQPVTCQSSRQPARWLSSRVSRLARYREERRRQVIENLGYSNPSTSSLESQNPIFVAGVLYRNTSGKRRCMCNFGTQRLGRIVHGIDRLKLAAPSSSFYNGSGIVGGRSIAIFAQGCRISEKTRGAGKS